MSEDKKAECWNPDINREVHIVKSGVCIYCGLEFGLEALRGKRV